MKVRIDVMLKEGVLDPQGKAIGHALKTLGFDNVEEVRAGKTFFLDVQESDVAKVMEMAEEMAHTILANLVIEDFKVTIL
ncbi:MAG TPA: phosphoribosylformylglycinamidine synthase [Rhodospirillaceae bacterium]|nr:phosphoribosylformylglycinamidine synthase [Rhodospirillaceae bacterium]